VAYTAEEMARMREAAEIVKWAAQTTKANADAIQELRQAPVNQAFRDQWEAARQRAHLSEAEMDSTMLRAGADSVFNPHLAVKYYAKSRNWNLLDSLPEDARQAARNARFDEVEDILRRGG
jgi:hypothetical protein